VVEVTAVHHRGGRAGVRVRVGLDGMQHPRPAANGQDGVAELRVLLGEDDGGAEDLAVEGAEALDVLGQDRHVVDSGHERHDRYLLVMGRAAPTS
jgi:hypothetical protein